MLPVSGQQYPHRLPAVDLSNFKDYLDISFSQCKIAFSDNAQLDIKKIPKLSYVNTSSIIQPSGRLPDNLNNKHIYIQLELANPSNNVQEVLLYAGFYFKSKHLFKQVNNKPGEGLIAMKDLLPAVEDGDHYRIIKLMPRDTSTYFIQLQPVNIYGNMLDLQILRKHFLSTHPKLIKGEKSQLDIVTYILVGVLFMMVLFSLAHFFISKRDEFVYYFYYSGLTALLLFFKTYLYHSASDFNYFFEEYLDFILQVIGILFYVYFLRAFLEVHTKYPRLGKIMFGLEMLVIVSILFYSFAYFITTNLYLLTTIEIMMKYLLLAGAALFVVFGFKEKNTLMNYIALGNASLVFFGLISLFIIASSTSAENIFQNALFYYDLGIVFEMAFFLLGLTYKNRLDLIERLRREGAKGKEEDKKGFEQQLALMQAQQQERNRISADMHDELGGGMTAIRLMSEIAKQRSHAAEIPEIEKISLSANDLLGKMNAIIWSMSLANDSLANLVAYTRSYALEFFENTSIKCSVIVNEDAPQLELAGIKRRNLFFAVKEILNNTIKNTNVSEVTLLFEWNNHLRISISDDGDNMLADKHSYFENSLSQIKHRMLAIGGNYNAYYKNGNTVVLQAEI